MLSRDFVQAFLIGQVTAGVEETQAKSNFQDWLEKQNESIASDTEKTMITSDLASYSASKG